MSSQIFVPLMAFLFLSAIYLYSFGFHLRLYVDANSLISGLLKKK